MEEQTVSWTVGDETPRTRSIDWYWGLGLLALVGAGASIFFENMLLAIIIILGAGSIGFIAVRGSRSHNITIDPKGIAIDGTRYPYTSVHSFWVEQEMEPPHLFLSMKGILAPHYSFPLPDKVHATKTHNLLGQYATEEEQGLRIGDRLAEIFGL